jgi:hypothetical protein
MQFNLLLAILSVHLASAHILDERAGCAADNCARAITGMNAKPSSSIRQADCSSFLAVTVTAALVYVVQDGAPPDFTPQADLNGLCIEL